LKSIEFIVKENYKSTDKDEQKEALKIKIARLFIREYKKEACGVSKTS